MAERLPLSALLSQALVAFTIELDNAWEAEMPHRTTRQGGSRRAPYATSLRQWSNFMRVLDEDGLTVKELERRTRAKPQLDGMRRWGYVTIGPDPGDPREKPPERDHLVVPTEAGRRAQRVWRPLPEAIEARWHARFGAEEVKELRATLEALRDGLGLCHQARGWARRSHRDATAPVSAALAGPPRLRARVRARRSGLAVLQRQYPAPARRGDRHR